MFFYKTWDFPFSLFCFSLFSLYLLFFSCGAEEKSLDILPSAQICFPELEEKINKHHILYLIQSREYAQAIEFYRKYQNQLGRHDFEILQQMGIILLEQGSRSPHAEEQLLSIYGCGIADFFSSLDILEAGIKSPNLETQIATIQLLRRLQDDQGVSLLIQAMHSNFLFTRMEAASQLAIRKDRASVGQIEALMHKVPPFMRSFFPQFFAQIGTPEAVQVLKYLLNDTDTEVRLSSILSAASYGRDDLLPIIRSSLTHLNIAEQEACATALGYLGDSHSLHKLKQLSSSSTATVKLAACKALYLLGDAAAKEEILSMAKTHSLFAIGALEEIFGSEDFLSSLLNHSDTQIRFNAAYSLLKLKDVRCVQNILDILIRDARDLGLQPYFSIGRSLMWWKIIPSISHQPDSKIRNLPATSLNLREHILRECLELPEKEFLEIAQAIFNSKQTELIPLLTSLLESLQTPDALLLLKKNASLAGAPLIRAYCTLSLFRLQENAPYAEILKEWIARHKDNIMIQFRPFVPWEERFSSTSSFELTPEDASRLFIESCAALADRHDTQSIDILLQTIKEGNPHNLYALAGLLIRSVQ